MKKIHVAALAVLVLGGAALSGCASADMTITNVGGIANGPQNERPRGGNVRYSQGRLVAENRTIAYKKMSDACGGKYNIVAEGEMTGATVAIPTEFGVIADTERYWQINFECAQ
jgi:hypothetical protein